MATPYLEMQSVEAWLGPRQVFADLTLSLFLGEHTVVLGPNGAGKSALIKLLSRQLYPVVKEGSWLRLFGEETINLWRLRSRIGLLGQDQHSSYRGDVRGADVVLSGFFGSVGLGRSQQPEPHHHRKVGERMARMGLADLATAPFHHLSAGQQRRLLLARALVHDPEILVLDEPTDGLDIRARHELLQELSSLARQGTTLLLVSHRLEEILPDMQRAILLREGRVWGDGATGDLLADEPLSTLFSTPLTVVNHGGYRQVLPAEKRI